MLASPGRFVGTILAVGSSVQARQAYTPAILVQAEGANIGPTCLRNVGSRQLGTGVAGLFTPAILVPAEGFSIGPICMRYVGSRQLDTGGSPNDPAILVPAEGASIGPTCLYSVGSRQDRRGRPIYPAILAPAEGVSIGPTCLYSVGSRQLGTGVAGLFTPPPTEGFSISRLVCICWQSAPRDRHCRPIYPRHVSPGRGR